MENRERIPGKYRFSAKTAACYFIFLRIFFGNKSEWLPPDFLKLPFLSVLGFRLSSAGQPLFLLQAGASRVSRASTRREKMIRVCFML